MAAFDFFDGATLGDEDVHLWDMVVSEVSGREAELRRVLDGHERVRADRFRYGRDRTRYIVSHWLVRALLAQYLGAAPESLRFETGLWGKPALQQVMLGGRLEFNLSHSGDIALVGVARGRELGVDVEQWSDDIVYDQLATFCFSPAERAELAAVSPENKAAAFFAGWTRKEAFIKATGVGVTFGLDYFDVTLDLCAARLVADRRSQASGGPWGMHDVSIRPNYSAAVVARGNDWKLRRFRLTPAHIDAAFAATVLGAP